MSLCKCGQESRTTHSCDLIPTPTVTVPIALNGQPATLGFMSTEYAAGVIANLQAERDRLRAALKIATDRLDGIARGSNMGSWAEAQARAGLEDINRVLTPPSSGGEP